MESFVCIEERIKEMKEILLKIDLLNIELM